jgi:hypothetical protein
MLLLPAAVTVPAMTPLATTFAAVLPALPVTRAEAHA